MGHYAVGRKQRIHHVKVGLTSMEIQRDRSEKAQFFI